MLFEFQEGDCDHSTGDPLFSWSKCKRNTFCCRNSTATSEGIAQNYKLTGYGSWENFRSKLCDRKWRWTSQFETLNIPGRTIWEKLEYINLEYSVPCRLFAFTDVQAVRHGISVHLMKLSTSVVHLYRKTKGSKKGIRWKFKKKRKVVWRFGCGINWTEESCWGAWKSNKELEEYVKTLEETITLTSHKGKAVPEASNKTRTLKSFMSRVETALWFSKSFGLP